MFQCEVYTRHSISCPPPPSNVHEIAGIQPRHTLQALAPVAAPLAPPVLPAPAHRPEFDAATTAQGEAGRGDVVFKGARAVAPGALPLLDAVDVVVLLVARVAV